MPGGVERKSHSYNTLLDQINHILLILFLIKHLKKYLTQEADILLYCIHRSFNRNLKLYYVSKNTIFQHKN
jgi:hypothetical protein